VWFCTDSGEVKDRLRAPGRGAKEEFSALCEKIAEAGLVMKTSLGTHVTNTAALQLISAISELSKEPYSAETERRVRSSVICLWGAPVATSGGPAPSSSSPVNTPPKKPSGKDPAPPIHPGGGGRPPGSVIGGRRPGLRLEKGPNALHYSLYYLLHKDKNSFRMAKSGSMTATHFRCFTRMRVDASDGGLNHNTRKLLESGASRDPKHGLLLDISYLVLEYDTTATDKTHKGFEALVADINTYAVPEIHITMVVNETTRRQCRDALLERINNYLVNDGRGGQIISPAEMAERAKLLRDLDETENRTWSVLLAGRNTGSSMDQPGHPYDIVKVPGIWMAQLHGAVTIG